MEAIIIVAVIILLVVSLVSVIRKASNEPTPTTSMPSDPPEPKVTELQYFCTKDSGYYVSVWPKDRGIGDHIEFNIAGLSHRENIIKYVGEHVGTLEPEPTNPYDPNAIKILSEDGHHVGYVPKDTTQAVRNFTNLPCQCYIYIGTYFDAEGLNFYSSCYITDDAPNVSPNN